MNERYKYPPGRLTHAEIVLVAMYQMFKGQGYWDCNADLSDIIVKAWEMDNQKLGMRGYEKLYPDSKKIMLLFSADAQRRMHQWFHKTSPRRYGITQIGLERVKIIERVAGITIYDPDE